MKSSLKEKDKKVDELRSSIATHKEDSEVKAKEIKALEKLNKQGVRHLDTARKAINAEKIVKKAQSSHISRLNLELATITQAKETAEGTVTDMHKKDNHFAHLTADIRALKDHLTQENTKVVHLEKAMVCQQNLVEQAKQAKLTMKTSLAVVGGRIEKLENERISVGTMKKSVMVATSLLKGLETLKKGKGRDHDTRGKRKRDDETIENVKSEKKKQKSSD